MTESGTTYLFSHSFQEVHVCSSKWNWEAETHRLYLNSSLSVRVRLASSNGRVYATIRHEHKDGDFVARQVVVKLDFGVPEPLIAVKDKVKITTDESVLFDRECKPHTGKMTVDVSITTVEPLQEGEGDVEEGDVKAPTIRLLNKRDGLVAEVNYFLFARRAGLRLAAGGSARILASDAAIQVAATFVHLGVIRKPTVTWVAREDVKADQEAEAQRQGEQLFADCLKVAVQIHSQTLCDALLRDAIVEGTLQPEFLLRQAAEHPSNHPEIVYLVSRLTLKHPTLAACVLMHAEYKSEQHGHGKRSRPRDATDPDPRPTKRARVPGAVSSLPPSPSHQDRDDDEGGIV